MISVTMEQMKEDEAMIHQPFEKKLNREIRNVTKDYEFRKKNNFVLPIKSEQLFKQVEEGYVNPQLMLKLKFDMKQIQNFLGNYERKFNNKTQTTKTKSHL